jgi:hypothetical protein
MNLDQNVVERVVELRSILNDAIEQHIIGKEIDDALTELVAIEVSLPEIDPGEGKTPSRDSRFISRRNELIEELGEPEPPAEDETEPATNEWADLLCEALFADGTVDEDGRLPISMEELSALLVGITNAVKAHASETYIAVEQLSYKVFYDEIITSGGHYGLSTEVSEQLCKLYIHLALNVGASTFGKALDDFTVKVVAKEEYDEIKASEAVRVGDSVSTE